MAYVFLCQIICRLIETDLKSLNSLQSMHSNHSRRSSEASDNSIVSANNEQLSQLCNGCSEPANVTNDDLYQVWGQIVSDFQNFSKKQKSCIQVSVDKYRQVSSWLWCFSLYALSLRSNWKRHHFVCAIRLMMCYTFNTGTCSQRCATKVTRLSMANVVQCLQ